MTTIQVQIRGKPATQGSKTAIPLRRRGGDYVLDRNGRLVIRYVDDCKDLPAWRRKIQAELRMVWREPPSPRHVPVALRIMFWRPRPKNHFRTGQFSHLLRDGAPGFPTSVPDTLKLARAVEDALKGVVIEDDSSVIDIQASKRFGSEYVTEVEIIIMDGNDEQRGVPIS